MLALLLALQVSTTPTMLQLNGTANFDPTVRCTTSKDWTKPYWPATADMACKSILYYMEKTMLETQIPLPVHEFLPEGLAPALNVLIAVRVPWKQRLGTSDKPCSLPRTSLEVYIRSS